MKNLMIVESPTKVKSIEKFLGPDFKVIASVGHVRDLVSSARKGIDVDQGFKPIWKVSNNKKTVIDDIKKFTKDADVIYFATDPDREGEAISKHLYDILDKARLTISWVMTFQNFYGKRLVETHVLGESRVLH